MTALVVLGSILLCLWLLSLLRVGTWVKYDEAGFVVRLKIGLLRFTLYPMKPRKKRAEKATPVPEIKEETPAKGGAFALFRQLLPVITDAAGQLKRKIRIDNLQLDLLWSHPDPAVCGMGYGAANGVIGMIWPLLEQNFNIKDYRIRTGVDFDRGSPAIRVLAEASLTVGQGLGLGLRLLGKFMEVRRGREPSGTPTSTTQKKEAV